MLNLKVYKKRTKDFKFYFEKEEGSTIDLTGCTLYFTVKTKKTDTDITALIAKTITSHTEATSGITTVSLSTTDTDKTIGTYYVGIEYKDADNKNHLIAEGLFTVLRPTRVG